MQITAQTRSSKATLMMHMKGSQHFTDPSCLNQVDVHRHAPKSDTYEVVTHKQVDEEFRANADRFLGSDAIKSVDYVLSATTDRETKELVVGARMFALYSMDVGIDDEEFSCVFAQANAVDGSMRYRGGGGQRAFVCDNLGFSAEFVFMHRHTKNIHIMLPGMMQQMVSRLQDSFHDAVHDRNLLAARQITDEMGYKLLCDLQYNGLLGTTGGATSAFNLAIEQWRSPSYPSFVERNLWSLFNAVTFAHTRTNNFAQALVPTGEAHKRLLAYAGW